MQSEYKPLPIPQPPPKTWVDQQERLKAFNAYSQGRGGNFKQPLAEDDYRGVENTKWPWEYGPDEDLYEFEDFFDDDEDDEDGLIEEYLWDQMLKMDRADYLVPERHNKHAELLREDPLYIWMGETPPYYLQYNLIDEFLPAYIFGYIFVYGLHFIGKVFNRILFKSPTHKSALRSINLFTRARRMAWAFGVFGGLYPPFKEFAEYQITGSPGLVASFIGGTLTGLLLGGMQPWARLLTHTAHTLSSRLAGVAMPPFITGVMMVALDFAIDEPNEFDPIQRNMWAERKRIDEFEEFLLEETQDQLELEQGWLRPNWQIRRSILNTLGKGLGYVYEPHSLLFGNNEVPMVIVPEEDAQNDEAPEETFSYAYLDTDNFPYVDYDESDRVMKVGHKRKLEDLDEYTWDEEFNVASTMTHSRAMEELEITRAMNELYLDPEHPKHIPTDEYAEYFDPEDEYIPNYMHMLEDAEILTQYGVYNPIVNPEERKKLLNLPSIGYYEELDMDLLREGIIAADMFEVGRENPKLLKLTEELENMDAEIQDFKHEFAQKFLKHLRDTLPPTPTEMVDAMLADYVLEHLRSNHMKIEGMFGLPADFAVPPQWAAMAEAQPDIEAFLRGEVVTSYKGKQDDTKEDSNDKKDTKDKKDKKDKKDEKPYNVDHLNPAPWKRKTTEVAKPFAPKEAEYTRNIAIPREEERIKLEARVVAALDVLRIKAKQAEPYFEQARQFEMKELQKRWLAPWNTPSKKKIFSDAGDPEQLAFRRPPTGDSLFARLRARLRDWIQRKKEQWKLPIYKPKPDSVRLDVTVPPLNPEPPTRPPPGTIKVIKEPPEQPPQE